MKNLLLLLVLLFFLESCGFRSCPTYANSDKEYARSKILAKEYQKKIKRRN